MSDNPLPPKRSPRPKSPPKKRSRNELSPQTGGTAAAVAEPVQASGGGAQGSAPKQQRFQKGGRPGNKPQRELTPAPQALAKSESDIQLPTHPVEVPPETQEEEEAAAAVAASSKPTFTVNIA